MSLQRGLEQIEHLERWFLKDAPEYKKRNASHSRKKIKKLRNRFLRRWKKDEVPNVKYYGWEW